MCGIVGYWSKNESDVGNLLLNSLKNLEYRGYDSWGILVLGDKLNMIKKVGKIGQIENVDFNGESGIGHCLHPESLIQLSNGKIVKIKNLIYGSVFSLNLNDLSLKGGGFLCFKHNSPKQLHCIKTNSFSIKCTSEHRMLVFSDDKIVEKSAKTIKIGDLLISPKKIEVEGRSKKLRSIPINRYYKIPQKTFKKIKTKIDKMNLPLEKIAKKIGFDVSYLGHILTNDRNVREDALKKLLKFIKVPLNQEFVPIDSIHGKFLKLPKKTSPQIMEMFGYFIGDGYVGKRSIRFKDTDKELLQKYAKVIQSTFNIKTRLTKPSYSAAFVLEVNSKFLSNWFKSNVKVFNDGFPDYIGELTKEEISGFLRGLFDAEGCVNTNSNQIIFRTTNEILCKTIQLLLLRFEIKSSFSEYKRQNKNWNNSYGININTKEDVERFNKHIKFNSSIKNIKAINTESKLNRNLSYSNKILPIKKRDFYKKYLNGVRISKAFSGPGSYFTESGLYSIKSKLIEKNKKLKEKKIEEAIKVINFFINSNVFFQVVKSNKIIESKYNEVFDLEVKNNSNFIANGLISHNSRWATHGGVSEKNSHPHSDCKENIFVAHNGIIENYQELKEVLIKKDHKFKSETDTEVIPHLIEEYNKKFDYKQAVLKTLSDLKGSYALVILNRKTNQLIAAKKESPLVLGVGKDEYFVASDVPAFLEHTKKVVYMEDGDIVFLDEKYHIENLKEGEVKRSIETINWSIDQAQKGNYPHFMLKEITEQKNTIKRSIEQDPLVFEKTIKSIKEAFGVFFVGCGTSYHACVSASYIFSKVAKKHVNVVLASEFRNYEHFLTNKTLVVFVSQSGETADVLDAAKFAKKHGCKTLAICNVVGSFLTRLSDNSIMMNSGPEICVLSTKSYTSQLSILLLLAYGVSGKLDEGKKLIERTSKEVSGIIDYSIKNLKFLAEKIKDNRDIFLIGRDLAFPSALEGALKIKEVSYIHAEGFAGGELKHGTIALIDKGVPCIVLATKDTEELILSNAMEIKSRGGYIIGIGEENNNIYDYFLKVPELGDADPIAMIIPIQILAYYLAVSRGCDPDKPRNLAKSVTVR